MAVETFLATIIHNEPKEKDVKIIIAKNENFLVWKPNRGGLLNITHMGGATIVSFNDNILFDYQVTNGVATGFATASYAEIKAKLKDGSMFYPDSPTSHQEFGGMKCNIDAEGKITFIPFS